MSSFLAVVLTLCACLSAITSLFLLRYVRHLHLNVNVLHQDLVTVLAKLVRSVSG